MLAYREGYNGVLPTCLLCEAYGQHDEGCPQAPNALLNSRHDYVMGARHAAYGREAVSEHPSYQLGFQLALLTQPEDDISPLYKRLGRPEM